MATVTLATLRTRARERADMVNSTFVTDDELARYLTASAQVVHGLLAQKFEEDYTVSTASVNVATTGIGTLPTDLLKLLGVEYTLNGKVIPMKRFNRRERNFFRNSQGDLYSGNLRYRQQGTSLLVYPPPSATLAVTVLYIPEMALTGGLIVSTSFPNGWEEWCVLDAAERMLTKEESDVSEVRAQKNFLWEVINQAAENRDAESPAQVVDMEAIDCDPLVDEFL